MFVEMLFRREGGVLWGAIFTGKAFRVMFFARRVFGGMLFAGWAVCGDVVRKDVCVCVLWDAVFTGETFQWMISARRDVWRDAVCRVGCLWGCCFDEGDALWYAAFTGETFQGMIFARWDVWRDATCRVGCLWGCCFEGGCFMGRRSHRGYASGGDFCKEGGVGMLFAG